MQIEKTQHLVDNISNNKKITRKQERVAFHRLG